MEAEGPDLFELKHQAFAMIASWHHGAHHPIQIQHLETSEFEVEVHVGVLKLLVRTAEKFKAILTVTWNRRWSCAPTWHRRCSTS